MALKFLIKFIIILQILVLVNFCTNCVVLPQKSEYYEYMPVHYTSSGTIIVNSLVYNISANKTYNIKLNCDVNNVQFNCSNNQSVVTIKGSHCYNRLYFSNIFMIDYFSFFDTMRTVDVLGVVINAYELLLFALFVVFNANINLTIFLRLMVSSFITFLLALFFMTTGIIGISVVIIFLVFVVLAGILALLTGEV